MLRYLALRAVKSSWSQTSPDVSANPSTGGAVAGLVGNEGGVVSEVINLEIIQH